MHNLAKHISVKTTPQSRAIPGKNQVQNNAGGFVYSLDCWKRLQRFLILGSDGGTYYATEAKLTIDNAGVVAECAATDARRTVDMIVEISQSGRAPKNDAAILALAILAANDNDAVRQLALSAVSKVCRIGTHIFQFTAACRELRGFGRGLREAIAGWYNDKPVADLAYQVTKYRNRAGYTHRDLLRLSHPNPVSEQRDDLYGWIVGKGKNWVEAPNVDNPLAYTYALDRIGELDPASFRDAIRLIEDYNLAFEHVPTCFLNNANVWDALLPNLKPTSLIRNLGKMTTVGLLKPLSKSTSYVCEVLNNAERIRKARVHPLSILLALNTYQQGHGLLGNLSWRPVPQITSALESAFYLAFDAVEPTNKRHFLAVDVSGSMGWSYLANTRLSAREASACMSLVTSKVEPNTYTLGFSDELTDLGITSHSNLNDVLNTIKNLRMRRTDCALPMIYAKQNKLEVDAFIVYTDNETWFGSIHPSQALDQYRQASGIDAKLIVAGMTATGFTIADPNDTGMLDVVGFDAACPAIMANFVRS